MQRKHRFGWAGAGALGMLLVGAAIAPGARAEGEARPAPATWIVDLRVVRVDASAATVAAAPDWQDPARTTTTLPWPQLLTSLGARGATKILLDQRGTVTEGSAIELEWVRKRPTEAVRNRTSMSDGSATTLSELTYVESGVRGRVEATQTGLTYKLDVSSDVPTTASTPRTEQVTWRGSHRRLADDETLVLQLREQALDAANVPKGTEVYVFLSARVAPAR